MNLETVFLFLVGSKAAILEVATNPWAVWVGLLLVLSTTLARNYATRDWRRQRWVLITPLAASVAAAVGLYVLVRGVAWLQGSELGPAWAGFRSFLGVFWLTAPLAWLYGLPVERFSSSLAQASVRRLKLLGVVAAWRVVLITRAISVLVGDAWLEVLPVVMLFGVLVAGAAIAVSSRERGPLPQAPANAPVVLELMGGGVVRPSTEDGATEVIRSTGFCLLALCGLSLPLWLLGVWTATERSWSRWPALDPGGECAIGVWVLALGAVVGWAALVPGGQRRWRAAGRVDALLDAGRLKDAVAELKVGTRRAFPSAWRPRPLRRLEEGLGPLLDAVELTREDTRGSWPRRAFMEQLEARLGEPILYYFDEQVLARIAEQLGRLREGPRLARVLISAVSLFQMMHRPYAELLEEEPLPGKPRPEPWPEPGAGWQAALDAIKALMGGD